jgi:hypothetical protein
MAAFGGKRMSAIGAWISAIDWNAETVTAAGTIALAFLTLVLAVGTLFLWVATRRLVKGADRTAEQQLRAYVFVENAWAKRVGPQDTWEIRYRFRNTGVTPSHETKISEIAAIVDWPMAQIPEPRDESHFGSIAPNGDFIDCVTTRLNGITNYDLLTETKAIVLAGKITYRDAFDKRRHTEFCYYITGVPDESGELIIYQKGNQST